MQTDSPFQRAVLSLLRRSRGEVQARQVLRHLKDVTRFGTFFAATILLPALLLSVLAINSVRSEELSVEADMRGRGHAMVEQISQGLGAVFGRFEDATRQRLLKGESPINNLGELSPYLRAAFRFDQTGALAAPFERAASDQRPPPVARFVTEMKRAQTLERTGQYIEAGLAYQVAAVAAQDVVRRAEARVAWARSIHKAGLDSEAESILADVYADHADVRDARGHRIGDVAILKRAEIRFAREPDVGAAALQDLVEQLLAARWTIGNAGEAAVTRRALNLLDNHADPDWLARARSRLNERSDQLYWAGLVQDELELVNLRPPGGTFQYVGARVGSPSVWAIVSHGSDTYAFSFSSQSIFEDLDASAAQVSAADGDFNVDVLEPGDALPAHALIRRTLGPWLPTVGVTASPTDPDNLEAMKAQRRRTRVVIVLIAVFMVCVGVVFSARIVGREVENARMKADFAANVSHELRSPITQIRLKGEALQLGLVDDDEDMQQHFDAIVRESERLSRLVDNVLDFAAIERGAKRYHLRPDDLISIVVQSAESARGAIESRGLELELDFPEDLPPLWLDREAVKQVLINLLSNAAKYGQSGGWVGVKVRAGLDGVDVTVSDRGIGIAPQDLQNIFEHFFRSTDPKVRKRKGTGIGLTIVRYIVDAHGGTITVDSKPGQGTTFTVSFPLEPPPQHGASS